MTYKKPVFLLLSLIIVIIGIIWQSGEKQEDKKEKPIGVEIFLEGIKKLKKRVEIQKKKGKGKDYRTPLSFMSAKDELASMNQNQKNRIVVDYLESILFYDPKKEGDLGFYDIVRKLRKDLKLFQEILAQNDSNVLWKKFYTKFAPTNLPSQIEGDKWKNWGETLQNTPNYIFSDDAQNRRGHLIYKDYQFYVESSDGLVKWNGKGTKFDSPTSLNHLYAIVRLANLKKLKIKAFGTSHSWSPICATDGILVDNRRINYLEGIDKITITKEDPITDHPAISRKGSLKTTATCSPGILTGILESKLWDAGYSLAASTIEDVFTIGGIVATSSHGVGRNTTVLSDLVVSMRIVVFNGTAPELIRITPFECPEFLLKDLSTGEKDLTPEDVWRIAQVNLGAFGLIWDLTLVVEPRIYAYFVTETAKWEDYFSDKPEARKKLAHLTEKWDTIEFWHYPLTFGDKSVDINEYDLFFSKVTPSDFVYIWKTTSNVPPEGYQIEDHDFENLYKVWVKQALGAKFSGMMMKWIYTNSLVPELLMPTIIAFTTYGTQDRFGDEAKKIAWRIPQWFANHPYPAVSVVEPIGGVLDIEWSVPMTLNDGTGDGLRHGANVYGHLIEKVRDEFSKGRYPVSTSVEMRYLKGSGCPLSPEYVPGLSLSGSDNDDMNEEIRNKAFAVPEIVSHSYNPYWIEFYERMNKEILENEGKFGKNIKLHLAKQFSSIKNVFTYLRGVYRDQNFTYYPSDPIRRDSFKYKDVIELWKTVRDRFDPKQLFTNPFIDQFFYSENSHYKPPFDFEVLESGGVGTDFTSK